MGALTPLGLDVDSTWQSMLDGRSGVAAVSSFDTSDLKVKIAAQVRGFDPVAHLGRREARTYDRVMQLGIVAAQQAVRDADLRLPPVDGERVGVLMGSGVGGVHTLMEQTTALICRGPDRVSPFTIPMFLPDMLSGLISIDVGAQGPNFSAISACATSAHCLGEAYEMIRRGDAEVVLAGGAEAAVTRLAVAAFDALRALSHRNDEPAAASRPFDAERDGFVLAEAAAVLVLESLEHALRRGARVHVELAGYGATGDAHHMTSPSACGSGAARAMRMAMRKAGLRPDEIGYVNAHGTSTPHGDRAETQAIKAVFGQGAAPPVSSIKGMTGHLLGAGGAVEAIACARAITDERLPPTINYRTPDPECDLDYVPNAARPARVDTVLSNSLGFGGHNVALVFRRFAA